MNDTPKKIKSIRKCAGLTQQQLADQLGVTVQAVKNWEGGRRGVAQRHLDELARLGSTSTERTPRVNSRPRYLDLDPGDWEAASRYGWCELKYDGEYCELRGGPDGWTITGRRGREIATGSEPIQVCHLLMEHIAGTEWARASHLFGAFVVWGALSGKGVHLSRIAMLQILASMCHVDLDIGSSQCVDLAAAPHAWSVYVDRADWEGLIFRTAGGKFARMKKRVTVDYVCTGAEGDSLIGALYNSRGKLIDKVRVPCPDEPRLGQVFEASGLAVTERGSLRNPRWERWRPTKLARECVR
jgi:transcriptional regulator with XRE-family HTH domain